MLNLEWLKILNFINPIDIWKRIRQVDKIKKLTKENSDIRQKLDCYLDEEKEREKYEFKNGVYYKKENNEVFCSRCLDAEFKPVHLVEAGNPDYWHCLNCKNTYRKSGVKKY